MFGFIFSYFYLPGITPGEKIHGLLPFFLKTASEKIPLENCTLIGGYFFIAVVAVIQLIKFGGSQGEHGPAL